MQVFSMVEFSLVCPLYKEINLIPKSLPSFYNINPSEVILCFDDPIPSKETYELCKKISQQYKQTPTEFVLVKKNPEYKYHQAWVRRTGFRKAKFDRILTVDADLIINKKVLKTVELVGKDNIGLVSCSKRYPYKGIQKIWRMTTQKIVNIVYPIRFTGLYAIWRPYWLDSEDEGIKNLKSQKKTTNNSFEEVTIGEDVYLHDCLIKKHKAVYLRDVGATCLTPDAQDRPYAQFQSGRYFASRNYNIFQILAKSILYLRFHVILGWLYEKRKIKNAN
jgi:glycosyltransferase involved in cell wall biosynthesis